MERSKLLTLLVVCMFLPQGHAFFSFLCRSFDLPDEELHDVYIKVSTTYCDAAVTGATLKQRCFFGYPQDIAATEVAEGIYMYRGPRRRHTVEISKVNYRTNKVRIDSGDSTMVVSVPLRCYDCGQSSAQLTIANSCPETSTLEPIVITRGAISVVDEGSGVFTIERCPLCAVDVQIIIGDDTYPAQVAADDVQLNLACDGCMIKTVRLVSECTGNPVADATFSLESSPVSPAGSYQIKVCHETQFTIEQLSHTDVIVDITDSIPEQIELPCNDCDTLTVTLESTCFDGPLSGATFSVDFTETSPGTYELAICEEETVVVIGHPEHIGGSIGIQDPVQETDSETLTCRETLFISSHPSSKSRPSTSTFRLCCGAYSIPGHAILTYQWYRGTTPLAGETSQTLTIGNAAGEDSDDYHCEVTTQGQTVASNPATVEISNDLSRFNRIPSPHPACNTIDVGTCSMESCLPSGENDACVDEGIIAVSGNSELTDVCGSTTISITYNRVETCACTAQTRPELLITVLDAETMAVLPGIVVSMNRAPQGITDTSGEVVVTPQQGAASVILTLEDGTDAFIYTTKVVEAVGVSPPVFPETLTVYMFEKPAALVIDSTEAHILTITESDDPDNDNPVALSIPPNAFYDDTGSVYVGDVSLFFTVIPPTLDIPDAAPGVFKAIDPNTGEVTELQTGGVFTITAEDVDGNRLQSLPIQVEATETFASYNLWYLAEDGTWAIVNNGQDRRRRRRRQTSTYTFLGEVGIPISGIRWYNIDKFPENTPCWFKAKVYDAGTGDVLPENVGTVFTAVTVALIPGPAVFPRTISTMTPSSYCYELRCDSVATAAVPVGHIAMELSLLSLVTVRATPFDISQYTTPVQTALNTLQYTTLLPGSVSLSSNLIASVAGPLFDNQATCEASGSDPLEEDNVLRFSVSPPTLSDPYDGSDDRCVARITLLLNTTYMYDDGYSDNSTLIQAINTWGENEINLFSGVMDIDDEGVGIACVEYRCSIADEPTNVTILLNHNQERYAFWLCPQDLTFMPPVVSATASGYFFNDQADVVTAVNECAADTSEDFAFEIDCSSDDRQFNGDQPK